MQAKRRSLNDKKNPCFERRAVNDPTFLFLRMRFRQFAQRQIQVGWIRQPTDSRISTPRHRVFKSPEHEFVLSAGLNVEWGSIGSSTVSA